MFLFLSKIFIRLYRTHVKIDYNSDVEYARDVYNQNWKQTNPINADYSIDNIDAIVGMNYSFNENHSIGAR